MLLKGPAGHWGTTWSNKKEIPVFQICIFRIEINRKCSNTHCHWLLRTTWYLEVSWWGISVVKVFLLRQWYLTKKVCEIFLWYNYPCYVNDISRSKLVRYILWYKWYKWHKYYSYNSSNSSKTNASVMTRLSSYFLSNVTAVHVAWR